MLKMHSSFQSSIFHSSSFACAEFIGKPHETLITLNISRVLLFQRKRKKEEIVPGKDEMHNL